MARKKELKRLTLADRARVLKSVSLPAPRRLAGRLTFALALTDARLQVFYDAFHTRELIYISEAADRTELGEGRVLCYSIVEATRGSYQLSVTFQLYHQARTSELRRVVSLAGLAVGIE